MCVLPGQHVDGGFAHVVSHHARESSEAYARKKSFKLQKSINFDKNAQKFHNDFFVSFLYLKISILPFCKDSSSSRMEGKQKERTSLTAWIHKAHIHLVHRWPRVLVLGGGTQYIRVSKSSYVTK